MGYRKKILTCCIVIMCCSLHIGSISAVADIVGDGSIIGGDESGNSGTGQEDVINSPPQEQQSVPSPQPAEQPETEKKPNIRQKQESPIPDGTNDLQEDTVPEKDEPEKTESVSASTTTKEQLESPKISVIPEEENDELGEEPQIEQKIQPEEKPVPKNKIGMRTALVIGYAVVFVIFVFMQLMLSPFLYCRSEDLQYHFLRPAWLRRSREGDRYILDLSNIVNKTKKTSFRLIINNPLFLKQNHGKTIVIKSNGQMSDYQIEKIINVEV